MILDADCVCFDVDSTVITEEGLDILAKSLGLEDEVKELTTSAMSGSISFRLSLSQRLQLLKPRCIDIDNCMRTHPFKLNNGIQYLIELLKDRGVDVFLLYLFILQAMSLFTSYPDLDILLL